MGKIFYGWIVCGVCTLLIFISMGTASNGLSVFLPYIIKACELTNTQASSLVTLRCAFAFLSMLVISLYYKRVGYRLGTCISALCCCAAYSIYSFANTYPQFCVGASMAGISYGLGSMIPVSILMNRWFVRHRALAIGICASGSGLAVIILPPILTGIILRFSLRAAFLVTAGFTLVAAVLVYLLIREKPADMGLEALGEGDRIEPHKSKFRRSEPRRNASEPSASGRAAADRSAADQSATGLSASERLAARRKSSKGNPDTQSDSVWILIGMVCVIMGGLSNPGFVHLSVLYTSEGYAPMTVAFLISLCGIVLTLGKVLCGGVADLMGGLTEIITPCALYTVEYLASPRGMSFHIIKLFTGKPSRFEQFLDRIFGEKLEKIIMGAVMAFSFIAAIGIFMVLPLLIAGLFRRFISSDSLMAFIEGLIRVAIFITYIKLVSRMEDIRRTFMYHGAEHKCINCVEHGLPLTVENVRKSSKEHKRCGTSFLLIVMMISILVFMVVRVDTIGMRILSRIVLVPVIAGISYEVLQKAGRSSSKLSDIVAKPGLCMQALTTTEPDDSMIEVAITATEAVFDWKAYLRENFPDTVIPEETGAGTGTKTPEETGAGTEAEIPKAV